MNMDRSYIKYFTGAFHGEAEILQRFLENVVQPVHREGGRGPHTVA